MKTLFKNKIKNVDENTEKDQDKYFINKKHFECTKQSDVTILSHLILYLQRKEGKQSLEILKKTNQTEEQH